MGKSSRLAFKFLGFAALTALLIMAAGFFAVRFGWTKVSGEADPKSSIYNAEAKVEQAIAGQDATPAQMPATLPKNGSAYGANELGNWCKLQVAADASSFNARSIFYAYRNSHSEVLLRRMLLALSFRTADQKAFMRKLAACESGSLPSPTLASLDSRFEKAEGANLYSWQNYEPWRVIRQGLLKDKDDIYKAAEQAGVQPRLLVSVVIVEQLRLYYTQRELFEKIFKPLEILANANKMAWGVMSIKEKMAIETEQHLKDARSPYYLGAEKEKLLDFPASANQGRERYRRLTDERSHYYSYLYGALILKQFENQWSKAGFPIPYRPEVSATLFNIGFNNSVPKADPSVGGSTIHINGEKYYFGSLAYEFYYSGELMDEFPFK